MATISSARLACRRPKADGGDRVCPAKGRKMTGLLAVERASPTRSSASVADKKESSTRGFFARCSEVVAFNDVIASSTTFCD